MKATRVCSIDGCDREHAARGFCNTHYYRLMRSGDAGPAELLRQKDRTCSVEGCDQKHDANGYCSRHRWHAAQYGDPLHEPVLYKPGALNPKWAGDDISYVGAHHRVKIRRGAPSEHACAHCGKQAEDWAFNHPAVPNPLIGCDARGRGRLKYSSDPSDYIPLCRPCHGLFDRKR